MNYARAAARGILSRIPRQNYLYVCRETGSARQRHAPVQGDRARLTARRVRTCYGHVRKAVCSDGMNRHSKTSGRQFRLRKDTCLRGEHGPIALSLSLRSGRRRLDEAVALKRKDLTDHQIIPQKRISAYSGVLIRCVIDPTLGRTGQRTEMHKRPSYEGIRRTEASAGHLRSRPF